MKNQGQIMNSLQSMEDKIAALQTNVQSIENKLTTLNNQMIDEVAGDADNNAVEVNPERPLFRLPKINFPKFTGQNPRAWTNRCAQFFELCPIPEHQKVLYASFHLEGSPEIWFRSYYETKKNVLEWGTFVDDICARFGRRPDDVLVEFTTLKQTGALMDYVEKFEELLALVICEFRNEEEYLVGLFIGGLRDELKHDVQMFNPTTVEEAARLARLKEAALKPILG